MISAEIEETIRECAREFDVKAVWIFGSSETCRPCRFVAGHSNGFNYPHQWGQYL